MENYENLSSLMKTKKAEIQEAQRTPHISNIKENYIKEYHNQTAQNQ